MAGQNGLKRGLTKRVRIPCGVAFLLNPKSGEIMFRTDQKKLWIFLGLAEPGTTSGWFNLKYAQYAA